MWLSSRRPMERVEAARSFLGARLVCTEETPATYLEDICREVSVTAITGGCDPAHVDHPCNVKLLAGLAPFWRQASIEFVQM